MGKNFKKRRTMLYIPGNNPAMIQQGGVYGADSILLDLEDAVALNQKDAARTLVRNMIKVTNFYDAEVCVRINHLSTPFGLADLEEIVPLQPSAIRYPKTESAEEVANLLRIIEKIEDRHGLPHNKMTLHAMIETAMGVQNVFNIASQFSRGRCHNHWRSRPYCRHEHHLYFRWYWDRLCQETDRNGCQGKPY